MTKKIGILHSSGLGDFALALPLLSRLHQHYKDAEITFITRRPFVDLASQTGYFNRIWDAPVPKGKNPIAWLVFRIRLKAFDFDEIYYLGDQKPPLVSAGPMPQGKGKSKVLKGWCKRDISFYQLPSKFALIHIPQTDDDKWSATRMGTLCKKISQDKIRPILIGRHPAPRMIERIEKICPDALDFTGQIDWLDMVALGHQAQFAIGHHCPDLYLIAFTDCPVLFLFHENETIPEKLPHGEKLVCLQDNIHSLPVKTVYDLLKEQEFYE